MYDETINRAQSGNDLSAGPPIVKAATDREVVSAEELGATGPCAPLRRQPTTTRRCQSHACHSRRM